MKAQTTYLLIAGFLTLVIFASIAIPYQNQESARINRDKSQIFNLTLIEVAKSIIASLPKNLPPLAARNPNLIFRYSPDLYGVEIPKIADGLLVYVIVPDQISSFSYYYFLTRFDLVDSTHAVVEVSEYSVDFGFKPSSPVFTLNLVKDSGVWVNAAVAEAIDASIFIEVISPIITSLSIYGVAALAILVLVIAGVYFVRARFSRF